jgi:adenosylmethionine-8-amino-7-oxononanoate aminotransferase
MIQGQGGSNDVAGASLPKAVWGKGSYVHDVFGKTYIDGSGGPAVYCLGHGNEEVNAAITAQLEKLAHGYRYNFTTDALEELTGIVASRCGGSLKQMVFVTGGSEAVESCLKLTLEYHAARSDMRRRRFISRERSWHGNTLGALSVSGFLERRRAFEGALIEGSRLSPANTYRPPANVSPADVGAWCARELEAEILRVGPGNVAGFIFEPVVGAAGACVPAPPGYAKAVREICDRHGVLMIVDEVMCGSGRTGYWRALEEDGVEPDIMSIAKGLAAGYLPLGAAVYNDKVAETINAAHGGPITGHTFTGHTACCAAGVAVQKIVTREKLVERVRERAPLLTRLMAECVAGNPYIGDIRGRGYFQAYEIVQDRQTKQPFDGSRQLALRIRAKAFEMGLICYPVGGIADGVNGDGVILAPPYNASDAELAEITGKAGAAIAAVLQEEGVL